jgi:hypothetical protein
MLPTKTYIGIFNKPLKSTEVVSRKKLHVLTQIHLFELTTICSFSKKKIADTNGHNIGLQFLGLGLHSNNLNQDFVLSFQSISSPHS